MQQAKIFNYTKNQLWNRIERESNRPSLAIVDSEVSSKIDRR